MLTKRQLAELLRDESRRNRLTKAMELGRVTQAQLAAFLGVTQSAVSKIANGRYTSLDVETCRRIAEFFGCSIEDLFPAKAMA